MNARLVTLLIAVFVLFNARQGAALESAFKSGPAKVGVLSQEDLEIISELDVLENLPLLSEEDFNMFAEDESWDNPQQENGRRT